jgi:putative membrane-bound dehydrogenase-like protein
MPLSRRAVLLTIVGLLSNLAGTATAQQPGLRPKGPLSPREELATFRVPKGFKVELVASEPNVVDPVAMAFDERGRIYVAEMPGYPNDGVATGQITTGRIKLLEDKDGDGFFETSTVYLDGLRFPTSVMPYKGGLLVANAPDLIYCQDTMRVGNASRVQTLYTGFELKNIQQLPSGLQWGLDNWVHACAGGVGGSITSAEKPDAPPVVLRGRGFRFHPDVPASLEPTSGGGQFGLATDAWGHWFTATNSQHLRQIVVPDYYLRRNPNLPVSATTIDIPDHGAACKVFRISPFESWRVERTTLRKDGPDAKRFPPTELFPGGYITSACSPLVYEADLFPKEYRGNVFVCEPANNLIHRDVLVPNGATFIAKRAADETDCEFFASLDTWCRPVCATLGPDGAIYVLDFYREVIETPLSLTEDMKRTMALKSAGKGRIWRIVPQGQREWGRPSLDKARAEELAGHFQDPNYWWRITAQRLLVEHSSYPVQALQNLALKSKLAYARLHALGMLDRVQDKFNIDYLEMGCKDSNPNVRRHALMLTERLLAKNMRLQKCLMELTSDPVFEVRFQAALSLGEMGTGAAIAGPLGSLISRDSEDPWMRTALLSSCRDGTPRYLLAFMGLRDRFRDNAKPGYLQLVTRLAALVTSQLEGERAGEVFGFTTLEDGPTTWQLAVLDGWGQGLKTRGVPLHKVWEWSTPEAKKNLNLVRPLFTKAAAEAGAVDVPVDPRTLAVRLLAYGPFADVEPALKQLLTPQTAGELQVAAVRALANHYNAKVGDMLLTGWNSASPGLRRELLDAILARADRAGKLLDAIEKKQVLASQLEPAKLTLLRKHPDAKIRARAEKVLKDQVAPARLEVLARYESVKLAEKPDPVRGKLLFKKTCAACHRLEDEGTEVGPDLLSALGSKTAEALLVDILDPSREVDPRYIDYAVTLKDGRVLTGLIAAETASSITLRRAEKAEDTLLRRQIDNIQATSKSLMPEGLEMQLNPREVYDVIAYLLQVKAEK